MAFYRECSLNHATAHVVDGVERLLHTVWFGWPWKRAKSKYFALRQIMAPFVHKSQTFLLAPSDFHLIFVP